MVVVIEIVRCVLALYTMKFGNNYLDSFVIEKNYELKIREIIKRKILYASIRLIKVLGYFFLIYFISLLDEVKSNENVNNVVIESPINEEIENVVGNENVSNVVNNVVIEPPINEENFAIHFGDQTEIIGDKEQIPPSKHEILEKRSLITKLLSFLHTEDNILLFVSYVFFVLTYAPHFFTYFPLPILLLFIPYGFFKMNMRLYIKYKYAKCFFFSVYTTLLLVIFGIISEGKVRSFFDNGQSLPKEIYKYFKERGYDITVEHSEAEYINVGIVNFFKNVYIRIMGNFHILKLKEQTAVLYHEIGHVENNSLIYRLLVTKFSTVMMMVIEVLLLKMNRKIISQKISKYGSYFLTFIILQMTILPFNNVMCNYFSQLDEYLADLFSKKHINPQFLGSALCEIILHSRASMEFSKLFSYFYSTHPSLQDRLKELGLS
ncbi:Zn-dependent protease [Nosema bombycis CQ1]|uniref:Zn-dependent protease n=1 Tax=Nosema bombycis (strain CQ1 / CVCC 102059) TaxID=578461 RepID=R0MB95_NOSB1|nr:Zn-dependent protease [Nosema bombycis CQ1]|eukprot:EOB15239.1 Zn-dependent protease [Nosema bombycis CQ1]